MKKVNFNQLKNIKTPDYWIDNAINIPKSNKKQLVFSLKHYFKPHIVASVASVAFCCILGIFVFAHFGNDMSVFPVADKNTVNSTNKAAGSGKSLVTSLYIPDNDENKTRESQDSSRSVGSQIITEPNEKDFSVGNQVITEPNENDYNSNTGNIRPSEVFLGTDSNVSTNPRATAAIPEPSTQQITFKPTQVPTQFPTQRPTQIHTQPPTYQPSLPIVTEPTEEFTDPPLIVQPTTQATVITSKYKGTIYFYASKNSIFSKEGDLMCHIVSSDGTEYTKKFSSSEKTLKYDNDSSFIAAYTPIEHCGESFYIGYYYVTFYDDYGNSLTQLCYLNNCNYNIYEK